MILYFARKVKNFDYCLYFYYMEKKECKKMVSGLWKPPSFDMMCGNKDTISSIRVMVEEGSFPNIILYGSPGSGKKSLARLIILNYLGMEGVKQPGQFMKIDGSIYRGVELVSDSKSKSNGQMINIQQFVKLKTSMKKFKLVVVYDFDMITSASQMALRTIIEGSSLTTRFIFVCSSIEKLIDPIISRCTHFLIASPTKPEMYRYLSKVGFVDVLGEELCEKIVDASDGSVRKLLRTASTLVQTNEGTDRDCVADLLLKNLLYCALDKMRDAKTSTDRMKLCCGYMKDGGWTTDVFLAGMIMWAKDRDEFDILKVALEYHLSPTKMDIYRVVSLWKVAPK